MGQVGVESRIGIRIENENFQTGRRSGWANPLIKSSAGAAGGRDTDGCGLTQRPVSRYLMNHQLFRRRRADRAPPARPSRAILASFGPLLGAY
ncbi:hypothetical protein EVAR_31672_1 [Eumeta japonica]|uniref:Uncharacterized protein n=1 Tax=Eumeta variegata TaxID=151549 RepID=A0A4C1VUQ0_EUMVA|nr:hypothetical protein EVAR_31672_1 [Eumeta japonica]